MSVQVSEAFSLSLRSSETSELASSSCVFVQTLYDTLRQPFSSCVHFFVPSVLTQSFKGSLVENATNNYLLATYYSSY